MSTETPRILIPAELLPADGRFGSGPSKVRTEAVTNLAGTGTLYLGTSHRQATARTVVRRLRDGLAELFALPDGYEVALGNGGTTLFWDAATFCLIAARSQHLSFGEFSSKFAAAAVAAPHLDAPVVIESDAGTHPHAVATEGVDAYCWPHNETSTGVMCPVARPAGADPGAIVLVDATSAAGGLRVDVSEADAYYFAPQKCFAGDGGLWAALLSPAAVARIEMLTSDRWVPTMLDLKVALDNSRLDQTYNTPALATLFLLADQVEWMLKEGGLEGMAARCDRNAAGVYGWAEARPYASPFVLDPAMRSHTVATIDLAPEVDATAVASVLRAHGIVDTESYRKLGRNQLRIALFPAIDAADLEALTGAIDFVVGRLTG